MLHGFYPLKKVIWLKINILIMDNEIFNKQGLFYYEDNEFTGIIKKNENGSLEVNTLNPIIFSKDDFVLITGHVNGKKVSFVMYNHFIYSHSTEHTWEVTYLIHSLFNGETYTNFDQLKFKNISLKINNISSTMRLLSSFNHNFTSETEKKYSPLIINPQKDMVVNFENFILKIRLNHFYESRGNFGNGQYANFKEEIIIIIEYSKKENLNIIIGDIRIIQNLFTFLTGRSRIIELNAFDKEYEDINLIIPMVSNEVINRSQYPSAIQLTNSNIENITKKWFENYKQFNSVYDLYFSLEDSHLNSSTLFLTYAQILESYHRQRYEGEYADNQKFKRISKKVRKCLKETDEIKAIEDNNVRIELTNKIVSSIKFSYEFTLHDRLLELFNELNVYEFFQEILHKFVNDADDPIEDFCNLIKNNRNYYTHYGDKSENVLDDENLVELNEALNMVIKLIFLKELDFKVDEVNEITSKDKTFRLNSYVSWM